MKIIERAHAKINLFLAVLARRPDDYHEVLTILQSLKLHDTLQFSARADDRILLSCSDAELPLGPDNLVWRAAELLRRHYKISSGAEVLLEKNIPVAAGLGGGSSDAAATLRGLSRLWQLPAENEVLYKLAVSLGADVPFCLQGGTVLGSGRGDVLAALPSCPHYYVLLINPGFTVSTAKVYEQLNLEEVRWYPEADRLCRAIGAGDRELIGRSLYNALETSTFRLFPEVGKLKQKLACSGPALMSGSGPTVFLLLEEKKTALELARAASGQGLRAWLTETWSGGMDDV